MSYTADTVRERDVAVLDCDIAPGLTIAEYRALRARSTAPRRPSRAARVAAAVRRRRSR
jgi:hypothetical protein